MARAEYTDIIVNSEGRPVRNVEVKPEVNVKVHAGSAGEAVFWAGETGEGTLSHIKSNAQGFIQVWLTEGRYDISIPHYQIAKTIDVINQSRVATGGGVSEAEAKALVKSGPYSTKVVTSGTVPLGSVTGSVTPNMAEGDIFEGKSTGEVNLQTPSNFPAEGSKRRFIEVELEGNHKINFPFLNGGWRYKVEPPQDLSSPTSKNGFTFYSDDGVTWYGVGSEELPEDVIRAAVGSVGQALLSDGEKYAPGTIPSGGLNEAEVLAIFEAEVEANFFSLLLENGGAAALKPHYPALTASTTLVEDNLYFAAKSGIKLTLPSSVALQPSGRSVAIRNESGGAIKVKGKLNIAAPAEISEAEITGAETVLYVSVGGGPEEAVWIPLLMGRTLAALEAVIAEKGAGEWAAMSSLGAKVEQVAGFNAHGARLEQSGANVRLRGVLQIKAGEELKSGERLCTLPSGKRPVGVSVRLTIGATEWDIDEGGKMQLHSAAGLVAGTQIGLASQTFSIT